MFNLFGSNTNNDNNTEECAASGWFVRPSVTRGAGGGRCPAGDHKVKATPVKGRPGAVQLAPHRSGRG